ncbi:chemotaxis protein [Enterovibrio norvegicus]|uniref:methyl-accepting chemotaxis protein n=1 Tax=Enterovibrio norvegicus TaxID=188144 RepID=UPI000C82DE95|nr:methyl-accepting chemotaxis protein [Enterovibrio norvegicus]MCC4797098.1 methyl-accepting chemotaxis protein [Enterovibrio norvegicus]PMI31326.1 chemotaxis protein [Enterovibrio norvegicus]PMI40825.1 chemotaxis protein [Enterovibrio norvegicus]PMN56287.1 chemotaxis protein [Enterovibrio norvegicus]
MMILPRSIKHKISLAIASIIIVVAAVQFQRQDQQLVGYTEQSVAQFIDSVGIASAKGIQNWIEPRIEVIESAMNSDVNAQNIPIYSYLDQARVAGGFESVYVGTSEGEMIRYNAKPSKAGYDPRQRPWYISASSAEGPIITKPYKDSSTGEAVVTIAQKYTRNNGDSAVIAGDIKIGQLISYINSISNENTQAILMDNNATILASVNPSVSLQPATELTPQLTPEALSSLAASTDVSMMNIANVPYLFNLHAVEGTPWFLAIAMDERAAFASVTSSRIDSLIFAIVQVILITGIAILLVNKLLRPLSDIIRAMKRLARGDLTARVNVTSRDEISLIANGMNEVAQNLQDIVSGISDATKKISHEVEEVKSKTDENHNVLHHHSQVTQDVVSKIDNMNSTVETVAESASEALSCTQKTNTQTVESKQKVKESVTSVNSLLQEITDMESDIQNMSENSEKIASVLTVIGDIAEQTNLLALNAAIEAARAGEQGRGFAVVADEVRALASRTQQSTSEINDMLQNLNAGTDNAVKSIENTKRSCLQSVEQTNLVDADLDVMAESVNEINHLNSNITEITNKQNQASHDISKSIHSISEMVEQLNVSGEATLSNVQRLSASNQQLSAAIAKFQI